MRGVTVPHRSEDFTADQVELYFDLVFVFAFSQLVAFWVHHPTAGGMGRGILLFGLLWWGWSLFTWSANGISSGSRVIRTLFLIAAVFSVPMAASVESAFAQASAAFAVSLTVIVVMAMAANVVNLEGEVRASAIKYSWPNLMALVLLLGGILVEGDQRVVAWTAAFAVALWATVLAGTGTWIVRPKHMAERHGLIVIVALGEVIVATGLAVVESLSDGGHLGIKALAALAASGTFAGLLWWAYFDRVGPALEHHLQESEARERMRFARNGYTYAHAVIVVGILLCAAALEEITVHPDHHLELAVRVQLMAGLAMFLGGVGAAVWLAFKVVALERLAAAFALALVLLLAGNFSGLTLLLIIDSLLAITLVAEHRRVEQRSVGAAAAT